jgi:hypothetical protein
MHIHRQSNNARLNIGYHASGVDVDVDIDVDVDVDVDIHIHIHFHTTLHQLINRSCYFHPSAGLRPLPCHCRTVIYWKRTSI